MTTVDEVEQAFQSGEINEYFYNQARTKSIILEDVIFEGWFDDVKTASKLGVSSAEEQKIFFNISLYTNEVIESFDLLESRPRSHEMDVVIAQVYANHREYPVDSWLNFAFAIVHAVNSLNADDNFDLPISQRAMQQFEQQKDTNNILDLGPVLAYPQSWAGSPSSNPYDISKWMKATRDIYSRAETGNLDESFKEVTKNWDKMEKLDYKHFLRFYQENAHNKYKTAQYNEDSQGYVLPSFPHALKSKLPSPVRPPEGMIESHKPDDSRDKIEIQRYRIISRLNAAEKLLSSMDGQMFAGDEQEFMLKLLQDLKRKVQIANKISIRSSLFEDYIYRTANMLNDSGRREAATFFYKIAVPPAPPGGLEEATELLGGTPGAPPAMPLGGAPAPLGDMGGGMPAGDTKEATREVFREFYSRLETGVGDMSKDKDKKKKAQAQVAPPGPADIPDRPEPPAPAPPGDLDAPKPGRDLEVSEKEEETAMSVEVDNVIEEALKNVTVEDVIARLDSLSGIFRKREVARQLSIVDMMMDGLGISSYFPSLGEASRSALESNQYVSTRIEDILSKLRGSVETESKSLLEGDAEEDKPQTAELRSALEGAEDKEKERKERRKKKEEAKDIGGQPGTPAPAAPGVGATAPEELAGPARVERGTPAPIPR